MGKTMQCKGFKITEMKDGTYKIKYADTFKGETTMYECVCENFLKAGQWVWNMANNSDEARLVNHKMCNVFNKKFFYN
jgi:hypothetical protein